MGRWLALLSHLEAYGTLEEVQHAADLAAHVDHDGVVLLGLRLRLRPAQVLRSLWLLGRLDESRLRFKRGFLTEARGVHRAGRCATRRRLLECQEGGFVAAHVEGRALAAIGAGARAGARAGAPMAVVTAAECEARGRFHHRVVYRARRRGGGELAGGQARLLLGGSGAAILSRRTLCGRGGFVERGVGVSASSGLRTDVRHALPRLELALRGQLLLLAPPDGRSVHAKHRGFVPAAFGAGRGISCAVAIKSMLSGEAAERL